MGRGNAGAAGRRARELQPDLGAAETLPGGHARTGPEGQVEALERTGPLAFPSLDGADAQRMEDLLAARLFPRQAALRIGRYTVLDRIGQGGMGVVYAAYDPELDRKVAIKLLGESLAGDAEARLIREAQAMARVVHANVVTVIEVGRHQGQMYVVMEHVRGIGLDRWPERRPHWRDTLAVYVQAGRGLAAAHRAGVIHRDFKPHNAMLVEGGVDDGRVKVLDFGLARAALVDVPHPPVEQPGRLLGEPLTRTGALMGTPAYMAPEQFAGEPASELSDQYSFAVSLYQALYGQLPFAGDSLAELMATQATGAVRPPPGDSEVPGWVLRVVVRGLARAPAARHPSMAALCDALGRDPAARRRNTGLALAFGAMLGVGGWGLAQLDERGSPCSGPGFELTEVWSDARAAAVREAFAATGLTYAVDTAQRVAPIVGEYADAWTAMRRESCETHQRGEQSDALFDLRMACLDRRRAGLVALTDLLVRADAALIDRAIEATLGLSDVTDCADVTALTAETRVPDDPALAREVAAERLRLAEAEVLLGAGRFPAAASAAEATLARAEALGFSPLVAESALVLGTTALEQGRGEEAERALTTALRRGIEGRADRAAAEAVARRLYARGVLLGRDAEARSDEELVIAHAGRFPADGRLQWLADNNRGTVLHMRREVAAARSLYEQALTHTQGPTPLEQARTRVNLGSLAAESRDFAAALPAYSAATAEATAALGPGHPLVQQILVYEAKALQSLGRHALAQARIEQALGHVAPAGEATPAAIWPLIRLSELERRRGAHASAAARATQALALARGDLLATINAERMLADALTDPAAAQERYAAVLARCMASYGERHAITATFQRRAAAGLLRLGLASEAQPLIQRSLATCEALEPTGATTAESRQIASDVALALGEREEAVASARTALALLAALPGDRVLDVAAAQRSLGRALLAEGSHDEAREVLRLAEDALARRLDADDPELAGARVELARASIASDEPHAAAARVLLEPAIAVYRQLGEAFDREREAAEGVLAGAAEAEGDP